MSVTGMTQELPEITLNIFCISLNLPCHKIRPCGKFLIAVVEQQYTSSLVHSDIVTHAAHS